MSLFQFQKIRSVVIDVFQIIWTACCFCIRT